MKSPQGWRLEGEWGGETCRSGKDFKILRMNLTYHIVTLGCQMNKSDSERVSTVIEGMGYKWTENEDEAMLLGILACSVRQKSIDKIYSRIRKWNSWKNKKNIITFVSGCVLPADRLKFLKLFDLVFSVNEIQDLPEMIRNYGVVTPSARPITGNQDNAARTLNNQYQTMTAARQFSVVLPAVPAPGGREGARIIAAAKADERIHDLWHIQPKYASDFEAFIPIQNGCDKFCTYCAVPYTRGREISRPSAEILDELIGLVSKGYKMITLLGQNVNSYGLDKNGNEVSFTRLLEMIGEYGDNSGHELRVYFTSPHPRDMSDDVLKIIAKYKCLAKQIHLPLQSGDDQILGAMNRNHTLADYMQIIRSIRHYLKDATIFTDIITGFSGETQEHFENTRLALREIKVNMAYIAVYSPRPGAASSAWPDDVPLTEKKERLRLLTEEVMIHSLEYNRQLTGKKLRVLVTGHDRKDGYLSGVTEGLIVTRFRSDDETLVGSFIDLIITDAAAFSIEGELAGEGQPIIFADEEKSSI